MSAEWAAGEAQRRTNHRGQDERDRAQPLPAAATKQLERGLRGQLLRPSAPGYDRARRVFNAMIDRRPALIIRCASTEDVIRGVSFARANNLALAVKAGGHGVAGKAVCDGGLMLDLSAMKRIAVDSAHRLATVQPGLTLGELDRETQVFGLATPTGIMSGTGLSGLALGGGLGWLNGKHGLTCDNLLLAEVVTSTGELVSASPEQRPELLWALRGGSGNFGVVTSFTFRLHRVEYVLAGALVFPKAKARSALLFYDELTRDCPDQLSANASIALTPEGELQVAVVVCHAGPFTWGDRLLGPLRRLGPTEDTVGPMPYSELQRMPDAGYPPDQHHYWRSGHLSSLSDESIDVLLEFVSRMPSTASGVGLQHLHGAAGRVRPGATAYSHRFDHYDCLILSQWADPDESARNIAWTRELFDALEPMMGGGVYVNNLGDEGEERVKRAFGSNYERLSAVKAAYDPTNVFSSSHNVAPALQ